jgi:glutamine amidotransferase
VNVVLVDSGGANTGSVRYALQRLGIDAPVSGDPAAIAAADRVILPGVGAAAPAMARLQALGLVPVLQGLRQPVLGICLGMQLLFEHSDEGGVDGLGLLPGRVRRLAGSTTARVPHIGWNRLWRHRDDPLLDGIDDGAHAYFVHGYAVPVDRHCLASCAHGAEFAAVVRRGNVAGAQFHPERSAAAGARLLANFLQGSA